MLRLLSELLFPSKCVLCGKLLGREERDICSHCLAHTPQFGKAKNNHSFIARWTCVWYYKDTVRGSILRYKFCRKLNYATAYGRILSAKLQQAGFADFDLLTWVPISRQRRWRRGYDQVELLAQATGRVLSVTPVKTLVKFRNTPPQSTIHGPAQRRANVLGAYRVIDPEAIAGKRILLLDDVVTTGATASECARMLLSAGAKEVWLGALAFAD